MTSLQETMQRAMRLMRSGDLRAATQAIKDSLGASAPAPTAKEDPVTAKDEPSPDRAPSDVIDVEFRVVDRDDREEPSPSADADAKSGRDHGANDSAFTQDHFSCDAGELDFRLFVPGGRGTTGLPLLVMLHGCTQSSEDFARGTRMNELAATLGFVVVYPEQSSSRNPNRCWNWFRRSDQERGSGEPGTIAALTRHLLTRYGLNLRRVYVAGLSAGGAMAAVLGQTDPDLFAAIGVHSGLPVGVANDVSSALSAMRKGGGAARSSGPPRATRRPAIVFHGDRDTTVHPGNGRDVVAQALGDEAGSEASSDTGISIGGRAFTRTRHRDAGGSVVAEHWVIEGAGHAWSGGDSSGTYTDPKGPDASAEMLRFFLEHARS